VNRKIKNTITTISISLLILLIVCFQSYAEFPEREVTIVVPYSAGGASDMTSRIFGQQLSEVLEVPVVIVNKTGASGVVGLDYVRKAKPDGYTIAYMPVESTMVKALGFTDLTTEDFQFIARIMTIPAAVTVQKEAKWDTLADLLNDVAENPRTIKCGNSGTGSIWHISAIQLEQQVDGKFIHVPFEGAAPSIPALLGGNIDVVTCSPSEVKSAVDSGDLKVLAVLGEKRSNVVPDVPTATELGYNIVVQGWGAFAVPKGTPENVVGILEDAAKEAIDSQEVKDMLEKRGFDHNYMDAEEMTAYARQELEFYLDLFPKLGIVEE
jgi:tripartite-type tricarboxylate transporter receptor subunit TctC